MRDIRGSEISDFLKDRFTWKLRWLDKLVPNKPQTALLFGTAFHKYLEVYYNQDGIAASNAMLEVFNDLTNNVIDQVELDDMWDMLQNIVVNYHNQWKAQDQNWKIIATELTFRIPLDDEIAYTGTIDLIYLDENDNLWIADHKTTKSIEGYEKNALLDRQISRYIWAVQQLTEGNGEIEISLPNGDKRWVPSETFINLNSRPVHGFLYNLILKEIPHPPKVLKKGGLSKDKSQHTTLKLYWQAIMDNVLNENDYTEMLEYLGSQETEFGNRYFKRVPVFRLQEEVDASIRDFHAAAKDLVRLEKEIWDGDESRVYMNITKDTTHSGYKHIISATIAGENVELIKQTLYRVEEE